MSVTRRMTMAAGLVAAAAPSLIGRGAQAAPIGPQAPAFFRYRVGDMVITAINDGMAFRQLEGFVPNAPPGALQQAMAENFLPADKFPITFTTLVVQTGDKVVLIDTGNGDLGAPTSGTWLSNFQAAGFTPADVSTVVFSHFHGDHINGFRTKDGTARFPKAEIMVPAVEWDFWTNDAKAAAADGNTKGTFDNTRRVFGPVAKDVTRFAWDKEILPGITSIQADGHTPGHTAFALVSGTGKLMVLSDTTNNPQIFARHPEWSAIFDQDAAQARVTRRRMLDIAATEKMQVAFYHAPFPATGHISREGDGFMLHPVMMQPTI